MIAKAGKPLIKAVALEAAETKPKSRIGFLKDRFARGEFSAPDDFDIMRADEILELYSFVPVF